LPTTRFLFWNVNRKSLGDVIADLADEHRIDVIILAESEIEPNSLLRTLNHDPTVGFHLTAGNCRRITIFTRFSRDFLRPTFETERISIRRLSLPARAEVVLVTVHLPSKLHMTEDDQLLECTVLVRQIAEQEALAGHRRTIVVGDLNMNPFEPGMVGAAGLHSVMSRQVAARGSRTVKGNDYQFFYNPMWNYLGDGNGDTAGSYYFDSAQHVNYYWNVFDQLLLRPELAERFDPSRLRILKSAGMRSLLRRNGRPDSTNSSDHLPIVFELEF
jgi:exonuclease III